MLSWIKGGGFDLRDVGQMNFYHNAADDILRPPRNNPSTVLLLCKDKKGVKSEA